MLDRDRDVVRALVELVDLIQAGACAGAVVIAVHQNNTSSEILVPPLTKQGTEKLLLAMDRTHFRMQTICYLGPKGGAPSMPPLDNEPS